MATGIVPCIAKPYKAMQASVPKEVMETKDMQAAMP
ncbi:hypothetical protein CCACVL1_19805 [Corchorus capsularis]|uniref:Uncharacterized protein n=1 Tax=Corchorus capsularis TaxID=210143 RepID=A0A1R3HEY4_COCAP|nr:hypothetical protein CCACVL1_19805 [Corchorus capsularis]